MSENENSDSGNPKTLISVYETMNEDQQTVVQYLISLIPNDDSNDDDAVEQSGSLSSDEFLASMGVKL